ncbi:MAG TPA: LPXTG cell wall anchor domain-containing protein [Chthoniobacterales bacterium]|nr:LPXTG cell wall anchor domain-containing protein [Chthoniobacterales bacterium]
MRTRKLREKVVKVSGSHWVAYATASAATMFAGSQSADAAIHYSGLLDVTMPGSGFHRVRLPLDQPGDSIAFEHRSSIFGFPDQWAGFRPVGRAGASFRGQGGLSYSYVNKLQRGEFVSHGTSFTNAEQNSGFGELAGVISGYFDSRGIGFVGFAFDGGAGKQYGWARVFMSGFSRGNGLKVLDYAYADPGEPIQVGQTSSDAQGTPALGSLGLLALGAAGLVAWRKRRSDGAS